MTTVGERTGSLVGKSAGCAVEPTTGKTVGDAVEPTTGKTVGDAVALTVGVTVGDVVWPLFARKVGLLVGGDVRNVVGDNVGLA